MVGQDPGRNESGASEILMNRFSGRASCTSLCLTSVPTRKHTQRWRSVAVYSAVTVLAQRILKKINWWQKQTQQGPNNWWHPSKTDPAIAVAEYLVSWHRILTLSPQYVTSWRCTKVVAGWLHWAMYPVGASFTENDSPHWESQKSKCEFVSLSCLQYITTL